MNEKRERAEKVLRDCAEHGVPATADPWPAILSRIPSGVRRERRRVPGKRLVLTMVLLLAAFGAGAYAASGLVESDLVIEKAVLQPGDEGNEVVVRARVEGRANLPWCVLMDSETQSESSWHDQDLTESVDVGNTTTFTFHERLDGAATDARQPSLVAWCDAGTSPGGLGPGSRSDSARVRGTGEAKNTAAWRDDGLVRKDMPSPRVRPPAATLSFGGRSAEGEIGSYCWSPPTPQEEAENVLWCWDPTGEPAFDESESLRISAGSTLGFASVGNAEPDSVAAAAFPLFGGKTTGRAARDLSVSGRNRINVPADMPSGEYLIDVFVSGPEGEAEYRFRAIVERDIGG